MEISREKLAALATPAYLKYQRLIRRDERFYNWTRGIYFVVAYAAYIATASWLFILIANAIDKRSKGSGGCIGVILFYLGFASLGFILAPLASFFDYLARLARKTGRRRELEQWFEPIEKEIETDAIKILSGIETEVLRRDSENTSINQDLRLKRAWRSWYERDLVKVKTNCDLNSGVADIVDENFEYVKFDKQKQQDFRRLKQLLSDPYREYRTLNLKLYSLYGRPDSIKLDVPDWTKRLGHVYSPPASSGRPTRVADEAPRKYDAYNPLGLGEPPTQPANRTKAPTASTHKVTNREATPSGLGLNTVAATPRQKRRGPSTGRVKLSPIQQRNLNERRMEIGLAGEFAVMNYERDRLKASDQSQAVEIRHTSLTDDTAGYDIQSWDGGREIYIEVKTTVGTFWSNLYLTENEFKIMRHRGEDYYLYRVCNFDVDDGIGQLFIYKGLKAIESTFDFNSHVYVLTEKPVI